MNFLAHLFLTRERDEPVIIGNFIGDFVKNRDLDRYSEGIRSGVMLHRSIDSFTDQHPQVLRGVRRLYDRHGKYASVLVDIFYDHLLARNWADYTDLSLEVFAANTYRILEKHLYLMPRVLKKRLPFMIRDNWLVRYGEVDGIAFTVDKMKDRAMKPQLLDNAAGSMLQDLPLLEEEFRIFFPDLIAFVDSTGKPDGDQPSK